MAAQRLTIAFVGEPCCTCVRNVASPNGGRLTVDLLAVVGVEGRAAAACIGEPVVVMLDAMRWEVGVYRTVVVVELWLGESVARRRGNSSRIGVRVVPRICMRGER